MKRLLLLILSFSMTALLYISCTDSFLETTNDNSVNSNTFYQTPEDAVASVNSAYAMLQAQGLWGRSIFFLLDFAGEEVDPTANTQGPPLELLNHTYTSSGNTHITTPWSNLYDMISKANSTILNVSEMENIGQGLQDRVIAEARFLRGLGYFYVNAIFGGGPLRTEENAEQTNMPRASRDSIWIQVEEDLTAAYQNLPAKGEYGEADIGRATSGAARAMLGKAYLYQKEWADAEAQFQAVIESGNYRLIQAEEFGGDPVAAMRSNHDPNVNNNDEAVFEVQFSAGTGFGWAPDGTGLNETSIRPQEYGVNGFAFYNAVPASDLIDAYNPDDPRLEAFYFGPNSSYQGKPYPFEADGWAWKKYQKTDEAEQSESNANMDVIRYADVLLMMSEAKIQQGQIAEGIDYINRVRRRADPSGTILPDRPPSASQEEAMAFLIEERRLELAGEQTRFFDLVRWGIAEQELSTFQAPKHKVFPIPQGEINANTEISLDDQNPGY